MLFSLMVMGVTALVLNRKGYSFERMLPYLLILGIVAYFLPIGPLLVLPFKVLGGVLGGIGGLVGGIIGLVFGIVGMVLGLVFGILGIVLAILFVVLIPLGLLFVVFKVVT